jgi:CHAD domain-containing protein
VADLTADEFPPDTPARLAVELLLRRQLEALQAQEAGVLADLDPEFLHDFRVAIRRTRSLLSLSRGILGKKSIRHFRIGFGRLGQKSGRRRDLDVQLADLAVQITALPDDDRRALKPVEAWLRRRRNLAHHNLKRLLAGGQYRALLQEWTFFLDTLRDRRDGEQRAVRDLAQEAILGAWRRVCKEGRAINDASPPAELHELRKSAKRLRYALEFFRPLLEKIAVRAFIGDLKQLQDHMGAYQDCRVQMDTLEKAEMDLLARNRLNADTALAVARSRAALLQKERELRRHFREHFNRFPCRGVGRGLQKLIEAPRSES